MDLFIVIGFATGAILGIAGSQVTSANIQSTLYEISSLGLITAAMLTGIRLLRSGSSSVAAGFLTLAIAEAIMSSGTALGQIGGQASFGAGMALYGPALLMINVPMILPLWVRAAGILSCIAFLIAGFMIFSGEQVLPVATLPTVGYTLLTVSIIGWIYCVVKKKI